MSRTPRPDRSSNVVALSRSERAELLGDGRRREAQRIGGGGDRAAQGHLPQEAEPAHVEVHAAELTLDARTNNWC